MSYRKEESLILENFSEKHKQGDIVSNKIVQFARTSSPLILFIELRLIVCLVLLRTNGKYHAKKIIWKQVHALKRVVSSVY